MLLQIIIMLISRIFLKITANFTADLFAMKCDLKNM